jgi:hypothetical protein
VRGSASMERAVSSTLSATRVTSFMTMPLARQASPWACRRDSPRSD